MHLNEALQHTAHTSNTWMSDTRIETWEDAATRFRNKSDVVRHTLEHLDRRTLIQLSPFFLPDIAEILYNTCTPRVVSAISPNSASCHAAKVV